MLKTLFLAFFICNEMCLNRLIFNVGSFTQNIFPFSLSLSLVKANISKNIFFASLLFLFPRCFIAAFYHFRDGQIVLNVSF